MSRVNPPPHLKMPDDFFGDRSKRSYFEQLEFILFQLWKRSGGATDTVADTADQQAFIAPSFVNVKQSASSISSSYTTTGLEELIVATSNITITLNDSPVDFESITIKRSTTAGNVIIDANGSTIDGVATYTMAQNYEGIDLVYSDGGWLIV